MDSALAFDVTAGMDAAFFSRDGPVGELRPFIEAYISRIFVSCVAEESLDA